MWLFWQIRFGKNTSWFLDRLTIWWVSSTHSPEYNNFTTHSHGVDNLFLAVYPMSFCRLCAGQISHGFPQCVCMCVWVIQSWKIIQLQFYEEWGLITLLRFLLEVTFLTVRHLWMIEVSKILKEREVKRMRGYRLTCMSTLPLGTAKSCLHFESFWKPALFFSFWLRKFLICY